MDRTVKIFCSGPGRKKPGERHRVIESYDAFVLAEVPSADLDQLRREYLVEDITDLYTLRVGEREFDTSIPRLVQGIVSEVSPVRIILFGSAARGGEQAARDIDLLVVVPDGTNRRQMAKRLYRSLSGIRVPYDLVVVTPADLEKHRDNPGLIYRSVLREGKVLYAA